MHKIIMTVLFLVIVAGLARGESAYDLNDAGIDAYANGKYGIALEKFGAAKEAAEDKPELDYNMGTTWAKDGALEKAGEAFDKAAMSRDEKLRGLAMQAKSSMHYDAAWSNYLEAKETGSPSKHDAAVEHTESALKAARKALLADPADEAARINYELAMRLQEKLKEQDESDQQDESEDQQEENQDKDEEKQNDEQKQDEGKQDQNKKQPPTQEDQPQNDQSGQQQQSDEQQKKDNQEDQDASGQQPQQQPQEQQEQKSLQPSQGEAADEQTNATLNLLDTIEDNDKEALQLMLRGRRGNMPTPEKDW
jgi:Ca-activated chloride channel homolog